MKTNFTEEEIADRRVLVKPIVEGAHSIRAILLTEEKLAELAVHWEAALSNVPTNQFDTLYREGMARRCFTAEQFAMIWDMKMESMALRLQHQKRSQAPKTPETGNHIPDFILNAWSGSGAKTA